MQNSRLFELLYLLLEHRQMTVKALAQHLEVSERTIRRDVDALSAAGVPVYMAAGRGGGVRVMQGFTLDKSLFTKEEQDELLCALQLMQSAGLDSQRVKSRISGIFQRSDIPNWIEADFSGWGKKEKNQQFLVLKRAILERRVLIFDYYSSSGEASHRTVEPLRLFFKGISWYLQAWCRQRQDVRFFKLTRMERVTLSEETFLPRPAPQVPCEINMDVQMVPVVVRFSPQIAYRVYDEFDRKCITRQGDGTLIVRCLWPAGAAGCGYLLSYGSLAEIVEPDSMRQMMRTELKRIIKLYE